MGFFSFLEPQQEVAEGDPTLQSDKKSRRRYGEKGEIFGDDPRQLVTPASDFEGPSLEQLGADPTSSAVRGQTYSQRRGEALNNVFKAADKVIDKVAASDPYFPRELADYYKREVRANPENAAKSIEKYFQATEKLPSRRNPAFPTTIYDNDFAALENQVRNLRVMKRGPEEKTLVSGLADVDLKSNLKQLDALKGQLEAVNKDIASKNLPEAVSQRGEIENSNVLAGLNQKAAALSEHIKQLEAQTAGAQEAQQSTAAQPVQPTQPGAAAGAVMNPDRMGAAYGASTGLGGQTSVIRYMDGLGIPKEALVEKLHTALTNMGIPKEQWDSQNVDPSAGMLRVLSELDKNGAFAQMVSQQLATAKAEDAADKQTKQPETDPRIAQTERAIQSREMRMRQLYAELRQAPFMQTWPGIILYVLTSLVTQNPAFAAKLIGGVGGLLAGDVNKDAVNSEIRGLQFEIRHLDQRLAHQEQNDIYIKREAARRLQHKEDEAERRKFDLSKMMLNHRLIIERNAKRGNPETFLMKKLSGEFQRSLGMASKYSGEMQNEFADPKVRAAARQNFNTYMQRAADIDAKIRELGGSALEEEPEE